VLEASRVLAQRLLANKAGDEETLTEAFRRILCRKPTAREMGILKEYHAKESERFAKDGKRAAAFVNVGEYPKDPSVDVRRQAALMQVLHMLYNMEESTTKS
jgi:hypothetical protein